VATTSRPGCAVLFWLSPTSREDRRRLRARRSTPTAPESSSCDRDEQRRRVRRLPTTRRAAATVRRLPDDAMRASGEHAGPPAEAVPAPKPKPKGHGRIPTSEYQKADRLAGRSIRKAFHAGDVCPGCAHGKLHRLAEPAQVLRVFRPVAPLRRAAVVGACAPPLRRMRPRLHRAHAQRSEGPQVRRDRRRHDGRPSLRRRHAVATRLESTSNVSISARACRLPRSGRSFAITSPPSSPRGSRSAFLAGARQPPPQPTTPPSDPRADGQSAAQSSSPQAPFRNPERTGSSQRRSSRSQTTGQIALFFSGATTPVKISPSSSTARCKELPRRRSHGRRTRPQTPRAQHEVIREQLSRAWAPSHR